MSAPLTHDRSACVLDREAKRKGEEWLLTRLRSPSRLVTTSELRSYLPALTSLSDDAMLALPGFPAPLHTTVGQSIALWGSEVLSWWRAQAPTLIKSAKKKASA
jgi:hypothetical protein